MQDPNKLRVNSEAAELAVEIYRITRRLPTDERFGLVSQLRRAAVGVGSCIAEGCGRVTPLDKAAFFSRALASCREITFQLTIVARLKLITDRGELENVQTRAAQIERMLTHLVLRVRGSR